MLINALDDIYQNFEVAITLFIDNIQIVHYYNVRILIIRNLTNGGVFLRKETNGINIHKAFRQFMPLYFCYINPVLHRIKTDKYDLNENQIKVILAVNHIGITTPTQLSHALNIQKGSLTTIIRSLVKAGFLKKENAPKDERKYFLTVTDMGKLLIREKTAIDIQQFDELFADMPEEDVQKVIDGFEVLTKYLKKAGKYHE